MKHLLLLIERELKLSMRNGYIFGLISLFSTLFFLLSTIIPNPNIKEISTIFLVVLFISNTVFAGNIFKDDQQDSSLQQLVSAGHGNMVVVLAKFTSYSMISLSMSGIGTILLAIIYKLHISEVIFYSSILIATSIFINSISILSAALTLTLKNGILLLLIATPLYIGFLLYAITLISAHTTLYSSNNLDSISLITLFAFCLIAVPLAFFSCSYIISEIE